MGGWREIDIFFRNSLPKMLILIDMYIYRLYYMYICIEFIVHTTLYYTHTIYIRKIYIVNIRVFIDIYI